MLKKPRHTTPRDRSQAEKTKRENIRTHFAWQEQLAAAGDLSPTLRLLGLRLSMHKNMKTGACFVSHATLAREIAIERRSVIRGIAKLEQARWIKISRGGGREKANEYQFVVPETVTRLCHCFSAENSDRPGPKTVTGHARNSDRALSPQYAINTGGSSGAPPEEREFAGANDQSPPRGNACGARESEEEADAEGKEAAEEETSFSELRRLWKRPWLDADDHEAMGLYLDAICQTSPEAILTAAKAWVAAADAARFLPPLSKWLGARGWEKDPPKRPAKVSRQQPGQRRGKADLGRMMLALGED